ncbi:replicative DNA helicase [Brevibacillus laterosporus]|uniref:Replicative DNA helicase n=1 Tax=Brevibacillus laterosporus TaxID=1465 RepID=A0AAP3GDU0_BRELA|nr:replicative DNA helicase [Brevibacillus laterosporus]MCR8981614.1 replicative DNA helicase [Brevibacillus laterosporus]MCZ0808769.1 replicative DNA helicase [Brevibacillus laterosporus]MCZ0827258.1 replicative DNA helicase [Brevibacillus laterosporus]MCZ0851014.1 replicative DNA helicase [Brevibacillus laterosporus]
MSHNIETVHPALVNEYAEASVLGAIFRDATYVHLALSICTPEDMYFVHHKVIYQAICDIVKSGNPIDIVAVTTLLLDQKKLEMARGVEYITQMASVVPSAHNIEYYAGAVKDKALLRDLHLMATSLPRLIEEEIDLDMTVEAVEKTLQKVSSRKHSTSFQTMKNVALEVYDEVEQKSQQETKTYGVPSGYPDLDRMTNGFQKSDLIILAARPSVGKTAFALNVANNAADQTTEPIAIFSLEMPAKLLVKRMICAEANLDAEKMMTGKLEEEDWHRFTNGIASISKKGIFIDDTPGLTVTDIKAKALRLMNEKGQLGMIIIDYLQLIQGRGRGDNRQQEVSEISRMLKGLARELNVPVVALSQLSRSVEQRQDKRPMLSDLRESGSIEQDADIVAFLYRDDYYHKETEAKNIIEIIIAKQRNGPTGTAELAFLKEFNKFVDLPRQTTLQDVG